MSWTEAQRRKASALLAEYGLLGSMGRRGNRHGNAKAEPCPPPGALQGRATMKVLERTETRLVLTSGIPYFNCFRCEFDRTTGRATIQRTELFWPRKAVEVSLYDVVDARFGNMNVARGGVATVAALVLRSGEQVRLPMASYGATRKFKELVDTINSFIRPDGSTSDLAPATSLRLEGRGAKRELRRELIPQRLNRVSGHRNTSPFQTHPEGSAEIRDPDVTPARGTGADARD